MVEDDFIHMVVLMRLVEELFRNLHSLFEGIITCLSGCSGLLEVPS